MLLMRISKQDLKISKNVKIKKYIFFLQNFKKLSGVAEGGVTITKKIFKKDF